MLVENLPFLLTVAVLLLILLISDAYLPVLRDIKAQNADGTQDRGSYSLGRVQMAFWTVLIISALVKLASVNGWAIGEDQIDQQLLVLMGISGVTGLAAMTVDVQKDKTAVDAAAKHDAAKTATTEIKASLQEVQASRAPLPEVAEAAGKLQADLAVQEKQRDQAAIEVSRVKRRANAENFFKDILEDENGNSLHRLQMVVFTLLAGTLFTIATWSLAKGLKLPAVPQEMLGLMGISSGLYVGFKIPGRAV